MKRSPFPPGPQFEAGWRARFTRYAQLHDDDAGIAGWSPTGLRARFRFFQRHWTEDASPGKWVDVGCGAGTYTRWLAEAGQEVVGVDFSLPSLTKARERSPGGIFWVAGDAANLPLAGGAVDGALCLGVTQALARSEPVVLELGRVVRPGGSVWVDGLNGWCLPHVIERLKSWAGGRSPKVRYESPWRLRRLVRAAGFEEVRLRWLPLLPGRFHRLQKWVEHPLVAGLLHRVPLVGALFSHSMVVIARRGPMDVTP